MEQELHDNVGVAVNESVALSPTLGRNLSEDHLRNLVSRQEIYHNVISGVDFAAAVLCRDHHACHPLLHGWLGN